jgi:hypothetical protein
MDYAIGEDEPPTVALAAATSQCDSCPSCPYEPVHTMVDGDVVQALFADDGTSRPGTRRLTLQCEECTVTMDDELITVTPRAEDEILQPDL